LRHGHRRLRTATFNALLEHGHWPRRAARPRTRQISRACACSRSGIRVGPVDGEQPSMARANDGRTNVSLSRRSSPRRRLACRRSPRIVAPS
jgi:hypothetical protein